MIHGIKRSLYKLLGLNRYLSLIQRLYLLSFRMGWLKKNKSYQWHYFVKNLVAADDVVVDIGANLGYFAAAFLPALSDEGHLYCVEPVAPYRKQLEKITGKRKNTTVFPFALGSENKEKVHIGMPPALHHLGYLRHGTVAVSEKVTGTGDKFSFEAPLRHAGEVFSHLDRIDYIKCDIEGYETVVFPAMKEIFEKHQPLVQLETWGKQLPVMLRFFSDLGYDACQLEEKMLVSCTTLPEDVIGSSDILFIPPVRRDRISKWLKKKD